MVRRAGSATGLRARRGREHLGLLDNINWKTISEKLGTRSETRACKSGTASLPRDGSEAVERGRGWRPHLEHHQAEPASESTTPWDQCVPGRDAVVVKRRFKQLKMSLSNSAKAKLSYDDLLKKLSEKFCQPAALPAPTNA